ncbi:phosphate ABC transporter permease subunit PstC [Boudabousia liubingyangii]|uniref:Phosphate transport system permease protein n=1 Tax=Boudabousia liubingyangii TaxID=1921764 RepID=A0A1Q5PK18_9ACTO|nr:phosphate ABC transporter permease subunit PstC [Boudabousia liubingyangii]OKL46563.1 phosphate ABC transporter permease subunit PstC [Boudabousia liubingyangii]OKL46852.1 phosphate ABC transporter permease subunit PstC [Boudabousia liubingyangii]
MSGFAQQATQKTGRFGNNFFRRTATGAAWIIFATLAAVAAFLIIQAWPVLTNFSLTFDAKGYPNGASLFQIAGPLIFGTVLAATIAMIIAVPISIGIALFISHYVPRKVGSLLGYLVDLLAAIPSVVFGLWGGKWLIPKLVPVYDVISQYLGWIPLFAGPPSPNGRVLLSASLILAIMILPIITAISREVFLQTPRLHEEAALALGTTRWEMIRMAVLPFGRSGIISASMLGLGRALGETMAVVMVLSAGNTYSWHILQDAKHSTIAANIASQFGEAFGNERSLLIATGLILFVITMVVNFGARALIARRAEFSGAN